MKILKLLISTFLILGMCGCKEDTVDKSSYVYLDDIKAVNADMSGYTGFTDTDHAYKKISFKESLRFIDEKATGIVYYSYVGCPFCTQVVPVLNEVAEESSLTVYYVDVHDSGIDLNDIDYLVENVSDFLEHEDGEPVFYVPQIFVYVNGEIVGSHLGVVDSFDPSMGDMSSSQRRELTNILKDILKPLR